MREQILKHLFKITQNALVEFFKTEQSEKKKKKIHKNKHKINHREVTKVNNKQRQK